MLFHIGVSFDAVVNRLTRSGGVNDAGRVEGGTGGTGFGGGGALV